MSVQVWLLDAGLLITLYLLWRGAREHAPTLREAITAWVFGLLYAALFYGVSIWIFTQPMLMPGATAQ